jgi:hypothetical protein
MTKYFLYSLLFLLSCKNVPTSQTSKVSLIRNDTHKYFYSCEILQFLNKDFNPYASDSNKVISDSVSVRGWAIVRDRLMDEDIEVRYSSSPFIGERAKVSFNKKHMILIA